MVGLGADALWEVWQRIAEVEQEKRRKKAQHPQRKRQVGGGRKKDAEVLCRLLVTLIYLRQHWTMQAIAESIECAESTVCNYIHEILPSIETQLPASLLEQWQQECPSIERAELERWLAELPAGALRVDTWEQPIPRPMMSPSRRSITLVNRRIIPASTRQLSCLTVLTWLICSWVKRDLAVIANCWSKPRVNCHRPFRSRRSSLCGSAQYNHSA